MNKLKFASVETVHFNIPCQAAIKNEHFVRNFLKNSRWQPRNAKHVRVIAPPRFRLRTKVPVWGKFVSAYVGFAHSMHVLDVNYFGNSPPLGRLLDAPSFFEYGKHLILEGAILVYPDEVLELFTGKHRRAGPTRSSSNYL